MSTSLVLVTGASGFIAGHIIQQLLSLGFRVRGTVRSLSDARKVQHLRDLFPGLELFEADLLTKESFDKAVEGADYVMHTASPFITEWNDVHKDLLDPAVLGTMNVLESCKKAGTVKRIVVTSSCAAIASQARPEDGKVWTENDWNLDSTAENGAYRLSKRLAEEAAWKFSKENAIDLVVINPSFVMGPPLSTRTDSTSVESTLGLLQGKYVNGVPSLLGFGCVDVRDVAKAHILAIQVPTAAGRYIVSSSRGYNMFERAQMLAAAPELSEFHSKLPKVVLDNTPVFVPLYDHSKAEKELGLNFIPLEKSMVDMALFLIQNGVVKP